jgi:hypothetical protein
MPDQYVNPTVKPCTGSYTWVPSVPPNIGGINPLIGFKNLIIDKGSFRNYFVSPKTIPDTNAPKILLGKNTNTGNRYSPIINATRPLDLNNRVVVANDDNVVCNYTSDKNLIEFEFSASESVKPLSCIQITYDLSAFDPNIKADDSIIEIYGVDSAGKETKITDKIYLTRQRDSETEINLEYAQQLDSTGVKFTTKYFKTANEILNRDNFPKFKKIIFRANSTYKDSFIIFVLKKIMFFTADRVNFRYDLDEKQLPCNAIGYSMFVNGSFYPEIGYQSVTGVIGGTIGATGSPTVSKGAESWPPGNRFTSNIHVKLFNPEFRTNSPGFAHSLNLHLLIVSFPAFGEFGNSVLPGVLHPYFAVIVGPTPFTQQMIFYGNSVVQVGKKTLAVIPSATYKGITGQIEVKGIPGSKKILTYEKGANFVFKNQFYYESLGITTAEIFTNSYLDELGIPSNSEAYNGSLPRGSSTLQAQEATVALRNVKPYTFSYTTYLTNKPNLYEIFTKSEPCLIFKCSNSAGFTASTFQQPGFFSAAIKGRVLDTPGLFDTKLIFRVFAERKSAEKVDFTSPYLLNHSFKIIDSGTQDSKLILDQFNSSWDFTNVLVSGNLSANEQRIEVSQIINPSEQDLKNFVIDQNPEYDIYCAIYAFSTPNDVFANYDLKKYTSLDLPLVSFTIAADFVLTLPIYYQKSFSNGGFLEAQNDQGAYGTYTPDTSTYTAVTNLYNGKPVKIDRFYNNVLNEVSGYSQLFTLDSETEGKSTEFFLEFFNSTVSRADFLILFDETSRAKINKGSWKLEIDFEINNISYLDNTFMKFEIDLINSITSNLVLKIASSPYQKIAPKSIIEDIEIPFFLPFSENKIVLKLFIKNNKNNGFLKINKLSLTQQTLEYFDYTRRLPQTAPLNFYEDLPIQPSSYVGGCSSFALYLDLPSSGTILYDPSPSGSGLPISGAIYSPTWVVELPEQMELNYRGNINDSLFPTRARGIQPYKIFFRTGIANKTRTVDTKRHRLSGLINTVYNFPSSSSDTSIKQLVSESFFRFSLYQNYVYTLNANTNLVLLNLENPMLSKSSTLFLEGQKTVFDKTTTILTESPFPGYMNLQPAQGDTFYPITDDAYIKAKMQQSQIVVFDYKDFKTFTLGVTPTGNLIYSEDQFNTTNAFPPYALIEGDPNNANSNAELNNFKNLTKNTNYVGPVQTTYPGLFVNKNDSVILYVYNQQNGNKSVTRNNVTIYFGTAIYARTLNTAGPSNPTLFFDFKAFLSKVDSSVNSWADFPVIEHITVCKHDIYTFGNEFYVAFVCASKVFMLKAIYDAYGFFVPTVAFIAGNLNKTTNPSEQKFIDILNNAFERSTIYKLTYPKGSNNPYSKNLESSQRVGFIDYDGKYVGIQFFETDFLMEVVFEKSFAIEADFRKIGSA